MDHSKQLDSSQDGNHLAFPDIDWSAFQDLDLLITCDTSYDPEMGTSEAPQEWQMTPPNPDGHVDDVSAAPARSPLVFEQPEFLDLGMPEAELEILMQQLPAEAMPTLGFEDIEEQRIALPTSQIQDHHVSLAQLEDLGNASVVNPPTDLHRPSEAIQRHANNSSRIIGPAEFSLSSSSSFQNTPSSAELTSSTNSGGLATPSSYDVSRNSSAGMLAPVELNLDGITEQLEASADLRNASEQNELPQKRRRKLEEDELEDVRATREIGACIWCQLMKQKCGNVNGDEPCDKCKNQVALKSGRKLWNLPCFRGRITDISTFRKGSLRFPEGVRIIRRWENDKKAIDLFFPIPTHLRKVLPGPSPTVTIQCKRFVKNKSDLMEKTWRSGSEVKTIKFPPYAVSALALANKSLQALVNDHLDYYLDVLTRESQQPIAQITLAEARRHKQCPMLQGALRMIVMTRFFSKSFGISGPETLGIDEVKDIRSPYYGRVPIPPMLDSQLDTIWRNMLKSESKKVLKDLKKTIMQHKRDEWLFNFLTMFFLVQNIEFSYQHQCAQLRKLQKGPKDERAERYNQSMLEEWQQSAENILNHFLIVCNGQAPLREALAEGGDLEPAALDNDSQEYVKSVAHLIEQDRIRLSTAAEADGETPFHWTARLLVPQALEEQHVQ